MAKADSGILNVVIEELKTNYFKYFHFDEEPRISPVAYREKTNSFIWKCMLCTDTAGQGIYIKIHKRNNHTAEEIRHYCSTEYAVLQRLHAVFQKHPGHSVVKPVAYFPEYSVLVTEDAGGEILSNQIMRRVNHFPSGRSNFMQVANCCFSSGEWLRIFQSMTKTDQLMPLGECGLEEAIFAALQDWDRFGIDPGIQSRIMRYVERQVSKLGNEMIEMSARHGDFVPFNIIVNQGKIIVLDFPYYRHGAVYYDIARFCCALLTYPKNPIYNPSKILQLMALFIEGWSKGADFSFEVFDLFLLCCMVRSLSWEDSLSENTLFQKCYRRRVVSFYLQWFRGICG